MHDFQLKANYVMHTQICIKWPAQASWKCVLKKQKIVQLGQIVTQFWDKQGSVYNHVIMKSFSPNYY